VSKERALRRAEREREAALRQAAHAARREREERKQARTRALRRRLPRLSSGRQTGILAERRRTRLRMVVAALVLVQVVVWIFRPDWPSRLAALVVCLLLFPLLVAFTT
jgi:Flp pilus assembly protein TadB